MSSVADAAATGLRLGTYMDFQPDLTLLTRARTIWERQRMMSSLISTACVCVCVEIYISALSPRKQTLGCMA